jgi:hypothetical protein
MATARLAAAWPMMCLSSSWTISLGVIMKGFHTGLAQEFLASSSSSVR